VDVVLTTLRVGCLLESSPRALMKSSSFPHRRFARLLRRVRCRSAAEHWAVVYALAVTGVMWLAVRIVSIRHLVRWTDVPPGRTRTIDTGAEDRILWAVAAVNRRLFPERPCLTQALAARYLLSRGGVSSVLRIGVAREGDDLQAHAWLEREGVVIIGGDQSPARYQSLSKGEGSAAGHA